MFRLTSPRLAVLAWLVATTTALAQDPFAEHIRSTDPLSAEDARKTFKLPQGFEIQLVAAEPEIQKPLNMAFDRRGRLWLTDTREYPHALPPGKPGRDTVKVLEDLDGDGRADRVTTFADGLNIPIGILPYDDGAIVFSIPHIWRLSDTNGDGRADHREKLYGPMGYDRDTHGLNNSFRHGFDGWIYACHGFNNNTTVEGTDGHSISMNSGNTYRFRPDGSRIEQFTWGQVNPFGMALDRWGNIFTADCHSKPVYQLLRGGYYPSFGKPHDGLGFVRPMMRHLHGSTAIAGLAIYSGDQFPEAYRGNMFSGNVMTSRVNRNSPIYHGSTIIAREEADFVSTTDPWFRPVDIRMGPDGALYIADFYNRIIGHYEVPLDHPGRDRHRGRIWRVVYTGDDPPVVATEMPADLATASIADLITALDHAVLEHRLLAASELADRGGEEVIAAVADAFGASRGGTSRSHSLWVLARLAAADDAVLNSAAGDDDAVVRVHAMKVLAEINPWAERHRSLVFGALADDNAFVRRAAADALAQHPDQRHVQPLLEMLPTIPNADHHLHHTARMALRNQFRDAATLRSWTENDLPQADSQAVADVCPALATPESGSFLLKHVSRFDVPGNALANYLRHAARYAPPAEYGTLANLARQKLSGRIDEQLAMLTAVRDGFQQRGAAAPPEVIDWAGELAAELLDSIDADSARWSHGPLPGKPRSDDPWVIQRRTSADGHRDARFFSSLPRGETLTGVLRSAPFETPATMEFYLAGHVGPERRREDSKNFVRLRDAETDRLLAEAIPPGNDTAAAVRWDLSEHAAAKSYLEIVDGDAQAAYAWLAVGRFEPDVVRIPPMTPSTVAQRRIAAATIAEQFRLDALAARLAQILTTPHADVLARQACAAAIVQWQPDSPAAALVPVIGDWSVSAAARDEICAEIAAGDAERLRAVLAKTIRVSPRRTQESLAQHLAGDREGAQMLLTLVEEGHAGAQLLLIPAVGERLAAVGPENIRERIAALVANLPSVDESRRQLMDDRRAGYWQAETSPKRGAEIYTKHCRICHQLDGDGPLIGPQLDGIGNRGLERLIEDLLAPNRNVDVAFRTTTIVTADGRALAGLFRRREGATLVFANNEGKEFAIAETDIDEQSKSAISLMPDNVAQLLPEHDFHDLMAFLLSKRNLPRDGPTQPAANGNQAR